MSDDRWCRQIRMHCVTVNLESRFLNGVTIALTNWDAAIGLVSTKRCVALCFFSDVLSVSSDTSKHPRRSIFLRL